MPESDDDLFGRKEMLGSEGRRRRAIARGLTAENLEQVSDQRPADHTPLHIMDADEMPGNASMHPAEDEPLPWSDQGKPLE